MSENLRSILRGLDYGRHFTWKFAELELWPEGQLEHCLASGLLEPDQPSQRVPCRQCGELADVHFRIGAETACLSCSECGPQRVPIRWVSCWQLNFSLLLQKLCAPFGIVSGWLEIVRGRVWRLGKCRLAGAARNVYLARKLQLLDARQMIEKAAFGTGSVVLVPTQRPIPELQIESLPMLISLLDVASWSGTDLAIDLASIEAQLGAVPSVAAETVRPRKRGSRLSVIEGLKKALVEHLRAARDYAQDTRDRTGTASLLPRPTQQLLADQLGVSKATVCRCLEDRSAGELRRLWEAAGDLGRLVA